tara:strand:+ start:5643 stop:6431 length:789 start_codon:yes stop_codon:yes gene_type:complete
MNYKPIWFTQDSLCKAPYKIMVCTPVHSDVSMYYCLSILKLQQDCIKKNIPINFSLMKSSLITQNRNMCVAEMLNHEDNYTHLLFIDSDIQFESKTIFSMLEKDKDVIACPYPLKMIDWDIILEKVSEDKKITKESIMNAGHIFPLKPFDLNQLKSQDGLLEVTHAPAGCMLIKRPVLETMILKYPELEIYQSSMINGKQEKKRNLFNLFDTFHDPDSKRYLGEDFGFCQKWIDLEGKIYLYIDDYITHIGEYAYRGRLSDI